MNWGDLKKSYMAQGSKFKMGGPGGGVKVPRRDPAVSLCSQRDCAAPGARLRVTPGGGGAALRQCHQISKTGIMSYWMTVIAWMGFPTPLASDRTRAWHRFFQKEMKARSAPKLAHRVLPAQACSASAS